MDNNQVVPGVDKVVFGNTLGQGGEGWPPVAQLELERKPPTYPTRSFVVQRRTKRQLDTLGPEIHPDNANPNRQP